MGKRASSLCARATCYALFNAVVIASYALVDGAGARLSGNPVAYTTWMFLLTGSAILMWPLLRRPVSLEGLAAAFAVAELAQLVWGMKNGRTSGASPGCHLEQGK